MRHEEDLTMRVFEPTMAALAAFMILAAAGPADAAWRAEENGPHPRLTAKDASHSDVRAQGPGSAGPVHATACKKWRPSTIKPFIKKCVE